MVIGKDKTKIENGFQEKMSLFSKLLGWFHNLRPAFVNFENKDLEKYPFMR